MKRRKIREILLLSTSKARELGAIMSGIEPLRKEFLWRVHTIGGVDSAGSLAKLLEFWTPDGCIMQCGDGDLGLGFSDFGSVPVVWIDRDPATLPPDAYCVAQDSRAAGVLAARELLRLHLRSYGYIGKPGHWFWSEERHRGFDESLAINGFKCLCFGGLSGRGSDSMAAFLLSMPKPAGVFCANDEIASEAIECAAKAGIAMPRDLAVVGVDDVDDICEAAAPSITSIHPSFPVASAMAARMLNDLIERGGGSGGARKFSAGFLTRRQSTRILPPGAERVDASLEMIRRRAAEGVTVEDVVRVVGGSRRLAELNFRRHVGNTVIGEIHAARVHLAQRMIRDGFTQIGRIHGRCGFKSAATFRRVFKAVTGLSPRDFATSIDV